MVRLSIVWPAGAAMLIAGCAPAPFRPVRVDCQSLRLAAVSDAAQRLEFVQSGFSILPPRGEHWCVFARSSDGVQFGKNLFGGRLLESAPSRGEIAHTFYARAQAVDLKRIDPGRPEIGSMADLRAFVERLREESGGIKAVEWHTSDDRSLGVDCVRFDMRQEQRNHPQYRGEVLILRNHGLFCRHPFVPTRVILADYSERYLEAQAPALPLAESLKGEVEPFVRSLEVFSPR